VFSAGSRYADVETAETTDERGRRVQYKRIRVIPDGAAAARPHEVQDGERLDHIAHEHYGDPGQFWRICDANDALWPPDLVRQPGRRLEVPVS
jgi:hypothetical protein